MRKMADTTVLEIQNCEIKVTTTDEEKKNG